jgi:hypothetical protein
MMDQEDKAERAKFNAILDALVGIATGTKKLEVTKTYDVETLAGNTVVKSEKTVYRVVHNG